MMTEYLAAHRWTSNADLIADVAALGYIKATDRVLDPTYGRGIWWKRVRPPLLVSHNRDVDEDGFDFRHMPYNDNEFDVVAYDPPYVSVGGRRTSTLGRVDNATSTLRADGNGGSDFHDRYGLVEAPTSPKELQQLINDGLTEAKRVLKPRGYVLAKCADYISSGNFWDGTYQTEKHAKEVLGLKQHERFEMIGSVRPQPPGREQQHARRNLSTLFVFQKGK